MEIVWLGGDAFKLRTGNRRAAVLMECEDDQEAEKNAPEDVIAVTHSHRQQNGGQKKISAMTLDMPGEYELSSMLIRAAMTPLAEDQKRTERNVAFAVTMEGITVCHFGRPYKISTRVAEQLGPANAVIMPVSRDGAPLTAEEYRELAQTAQSIDAKWMIGSGSQGPDDPAAAAFLKAVNGEENGDSSPNRLSITAGNQPERLQAVIMAPEAKRRR